MGSVIQRHHRTVSVKAVAPTARRRERLKRRSFVPRNGSGKSNILDSICFVLGITNLSTVSAVRHEDRPEEKADAFAVVLVLSNCRSAPPTCSTSFTSAGRPASLALPSPSSLTTRTRPSHPSDSKRWQRSRSRGRSVPGFRLDRCPAGGLIRSPVSFADLGQWSEQVPDLRTSVNTTSRTESVSERAAQHQQPKLSHHAGSVAPSKPLRDAPRLTTLISQARSPRS